MTVTTPVGTSAASKRDHFKYTPAVEGVAPNTGLTLPRRLALGARGAAVTLPQ